MPTAFDYPPRRQRRHRPTREERQSPCISSASGSTSRSGARLWTVRTWLIGSLELISHTKRLSVDAASGAVKLVPTGDKRDFPGLVGGAHALIEGADDARWSSRWARPTGRWPEPAGLLQVRPSAWPWQVPQPPWPSGRLPLLERGPGVLPSRHDRRHGLQIERLGQLHVDGYPRLGRAMRSTSRPPGAPCAVAATKPSSN
jgi:hypothetical protein